MTYLSDSISFEDDDKFVVKFSTWEGPIEAMLDLARSQKLDLLQINILELVTQFEFVLNRAVALRLELAADWLVMAAWLTYLKSRILLKTPKKDDKEDLSEDALAFHLKRLEAVKASALALQKQNMIGTDWFAPGAAVQTTRLGNRIPVTFQEFLASYPKPKNKETQSQPRILKPFDLASVESAIERLKIEIPDSEWVNLIDLIPRSSGLRLRSNIATSLIGTLELTRNGQLQIMQNDLMEPIYVRRVINAT